MSKKDFLSILDLTPEEIRNVIQKAKDFKNGYKSRPLEGKVIALLFEKPSLRTRVSFEVGIRELGGECIYLSQDDVGLGKREPVSDVAQVLDRWVDGIVARVFSHNSLVILAKNSSIPIINALSNEYKDRADNISVINPLGFFDISELERSELFEDYFVPLNSVVRVIISPENPTQVDTIKSNVITKLTNVEDLSQTGWFFSSTSYDMIDARFLFGQSDSVTADELVMEIDAWDIQSGDDSFLIDNINVRIQNTEGEQYIILAVIIIAAIGAAIFYLKGYKRS